MRCSSRSCSPGARELVAGLADERSRLLADALDAEQRERQALAEALHDEALQNLLSARHELAEAARSSTTPRWSAPTARVAATVGQLRDAVFELHPYVLEQAGLRRRCARSPSRRPSAAASS